MCRRVGPTIAALVLAATYAVGARPVGAQTTTTAKPSSGTTTTTAKSPSGSSGTTSSTKSTKSTSANEPTAWILVDAATGNVLGGRNLHTAYPVASTAALMTALTAATRLPFAAPVRVSELAAAQPARAVGMKPGQVWTFGDALRALLIANANDAAYAIAETAGGDLGAFAAQMNQRAQAMGMRDSTFNDPAGIDGKGAFQGGSRVSPYDLAIAARNLHAAPELAEIPAARTYEHAGPDGAYAFQNVNLPFLDAYKSGDGMRAGFSDAAGRTLVATATKDGRTMIAAVLATSDPIGWATRLLDRGFASNAATPTVDQALPPVQNATAEAAARALGALPRVLGRPVLAAATGGAAAPGAPAVTTTAAQKTRTSSGGGGSAPAIVLLGLLAAVTVVVLLRVRAVNRRRRRRVARLRAFHDAKRRGSITVLDAEQYDQPTHVRTVSSRR